MRALASTRRARLLLVAALVVAAAIATTAVAVATRGHAPTAQQTRARAAAESFFDDWVDADGRVVRRDQGGDTVSEGQAYGLLLAVAVGDQPRFDRIWTWTRDHLLRDDDLLSWIWKDGEVVDPTPASDADVDTAWALLLAGEKFGVDRYTTQGRTTAAAVLRHETVDVSPGRLLVGGPWATKSPYTINPSYLVGGVATYLAEATGDSGWRQVAKAETALDARLVGAKTLPPDWARLDEGKSVDDVQAAGAPDGSRGPGYNLDAPRTVVRLAASCSSDDRRTAASVAQLLGSTGEPTQRNIDGSSAGDYTHPLSDVAVAGAASARGDRASTDDALNSAADQQRRSPSYYGGAWVALGRVLLTTDWLRSCAPTAKE